MSQRRNRLLRIIRTFRTSTGFVCVPTFYFAAGKLCRELVDDVSQRFAVFHITNCAICSRIASSCSRVVRSRRLLVGRICAVFFVANTAVRLLKAGSRFGESVYEFVYATVAVHVSFTVVTKRLLYDLRRIRTCFARRFIYVTAMEICIPTVARTRNASSCFLNQYQFMVKRFGINGFTSTAERALLARCGLGISVFKGFVVTECGIN